MMKATYLKGLDHMYNSKHLELAKEMFEEAIAFSDRMSDKQMKWVSLCIC